MSELSQRELERQELNGQCAQDAVDHADSKWPEIAGAAAMVVNCHEALIKLGVPHGVAFGLIPSVIEVLKMRK